MPTMVAEAPPLPAAGAISIGLVRAEHRSVPPLERAQNAEFTLESGEPLRLFLVLRAGLPSTMLVTALVDYQQVPILLNEERALLHEVPLEADVVVELPLEIEVGGPGAHDLVLVAFHNPHDRPFDESYRLRMSQRLVGKRARVIVGDSEAPVLDVVPSLTGALPPPELRDQFLQLVTYARVAGARSEEHPTRRVLHMGEGQAGQEYPFQLRISGARDRQMTYAIVQFMDYEQIDIEDLQVLFVRLGPGEEALLDGSLTLPSIPGVHELQAVYIADPYESLLAGADPIVTGSPAVGIDVRP